MEPTVADGTGGLKGQFVRAQHFFGAGVRGTFAHYVRPTDGGGHKRCVRVELLEMSRDGAGPANPPIKMEMELADAAGLVSVLLGEAPLFRATLIRRGVKKQLQLARGRDKGLSWVLLMKEQRGEGGKRELRCPIQADDALKIAGVIGSVIEQFNPDMTPAVWHQYAQRIGSLVAGTAGDTE